LLADLRNYNLLLLASESGNVKPIEALLKYGINPQVILQAGEVTAQGLTWLNFHSDVLLKLLQANLPFPADIDINECSEELKRFIETGQEFHKMIKEENKVKLDEIIKQNPNLRYFYNLSNKSALKAALDLKLIDIYDLLISKNLPFAPHEDIDEIWEQFNKSEKIKLRNINFKYLKDIPEKHINILMFNTSLSHDEKDEEGKMKMILRAYKALNADPRLNIVLKIVAATKVFKIIFDFNRDSAYRIDPTTGPWTKGIFYFSGRIIVGAKQLLNQETERDTFSVMIHELCHYAVLAVYQNQSDPFKANDQEAKEEFARIAELCKVNIEDEPVIQSVFDDYPEEHQPSELIVRPPQLIALYSKEPELLQEVIDTFNELFDYYLNVVVPAMERALPEIEGRLAYKPTYNYVQLSDQNKEKVQNAFVTYKNVKVNFVELFPGNSDIFELLTSDHISLMLDNKVLNFDDPQFHYLEEKIDFKWENLAEKLREKFLNSSFNFQGEIVKFKDLNDLNLYPGAFNALKSKQIIDVLSGTEFNVWKKVESLEEEYIERNFIIENIRTLFGEYLSNRTVNVENITENSDVQEFSDWSVQNYNSRLDEIFDNKLKKKLFFNKFQVTSKRMHKSIDDIIDQVESEKVFVLSEEDVGKTMTFKKIALKFKKKTPLRWVSFIDITLYTKFYKTRGATENVLGLLKNILDLSSEKNEFEVEVFEKSFNSGNVILIWDGIQINKKSTEYHEFLLNTFSFIRESTENIQFISTTPLYSEQLGNALKTNPWKLVIIDLNYISFGIQPLPQLT